jgi:hypothetical protein
MRGKESKSKEELGEINERGVSKVSARMREVDGDGRKEEGLVP